MTAIRGKQVYASTTRRMCSTGNTSNTSMRTWQGTAWHGLVRLGAAHSSMAQPGMAWYGSVRLGSARLRPWLYMVRPGMARPSRAWNATSRHATKRQATPPHHDTAPHRTAPLALHTHVHRCMRTCRVTCARARVGQIRKKSLFHCCAASAKNRPQFYRHACQDLRTHASHDACSVCMLFTGGTHSECTISPDPIATAIADGADEGFRTKTKSGARTMGRTTPD